MNEYFFIVELLVHLWLLKLSEFAVCLLELLTAELPGQYNKESWAMDYDEKFAALPKLREDGNRLYGEQKYHEAATMYAEALNMLEQLCLRLVSHHTYS